MLNIIIEQNTCDVMNNDSSDTLQKIPAKTQPVQND